jgi:Uncharacterized protein conserved in bacteria
MGRTMKSAFIRFSCRVAFRLTIALFVACILTVIAASLGGLHEVLDLASLAAFPAAVVAALAGAVLLIRAPSLVWRVLVIGCLLTTTPVFIAVRGQPSVCRDRSSALKIAWLNAHNPGAAAPISDWIDAEAPQIVGLAEVGPRSASLRKHLEKRYPYRLSCLKNGRCSTMLYSVLAPASGRSLAHGDPEDRKALSAVYMAIGAADGTAFDVVALHLSRPLPMGRQASELAKLEAEVDPSPGAIIMGDFNMSPRMKILQNFAASRGLTVTRTPQPTWPTELMGRKTKGLWQIDHLLIGKAWDVAEIRVSPDLGSDHRGYIATLCRARLH